MLFNTAALNGTVGRWTLDVGRILTGGVTVTCSRSQPQAFVAIIWMFCLEALAFAGILCATHPANNPALLEASWKLVSWLFASKRGLFFRLSIKDRKESSPDLQQNTTTNTSSLLFHVPNPREAEIV